MNKTTAGKVANKLADALLMAVKGCVFIAFTYRIPELITAIKAW